MQCSAGVVHASPSNAPTCAVPCLRRAAEVESGNAEFALGGDEEGWVATHRSPGEAGTGGQQAGSSGAEGAQPRKSDDGIPSIDEAEMSKQPAAAGAEGATPTASAPGGLSNVAGASAAVKQQADDDIPDISDLALGAAADDEVRCTAMCELQWSRCRGSNHVCSRPSWACGHWGKWTSCLMRSVAKLSQLALPGDMTSRKVCVDLLLPLRLCLQAALPPTIAIAAGRGGYLSAEEPADTIVRTRTYDLYITYDQVWHTLRGLGHSHTTDQVRDSVSAQGNDAFGPE